MTGKSTVEPIRVGVTWSADVADASKAATRFSRAMGFTALESDEIGLVATELATNLIRHASGGTIELNGLGSEARTGIEIQSTDNGPGISNVEDAIADGFSSDGGLGLGLGTVNRLMDELEFHSGAGG